MDSTGDAVVELGVQFGKLVAGVDARLRNVPHSSGFNNVPDDKLSDGLILRHALGAVGAADVLDMTSAMLVPPMVPTLRCHL
jgi:hypothetical protein